MKGMAFQQLGSDPALLAIQQPTRRLVVDARQKEGSVVTQTFTAGQTVAIPHGLGYQPTAWVILDCVTGYSSFRRTAWDPNTITLQAENACTATFRVT